MKDILIQIGFVEREAALYELLLASGELPLQDLANRANLKQSTCYVALERLTNARLVQVETKGRKSWYRAAAPSAITALIEEQEAQLQAQKNLLKARLAAYAKPALKPERYEGEALRNLEEAGLDQVEPGSVVLGLDGPKGLLNTQEGAEHRVDKGILSQSIYLAEKDIPEADNRVALRTGVRLSAQELDLPGSVQVVPGWGIKITHEGKSPYGIAMEDAGVADVMQALFDLAWEGALVRKIRAGRR